MEPTAPPGPTMKTLNEIPPTWSQTFDNASERFELVLWDQAVLDKETGLVWARNANIANTFMPWDNAVRSCYNREIGERKGWRLPTIEELATLVDPHSTNPALPPGFSSFFDNVQNSCYFSITTNTYHPDIVWAIHMTDGSVIEETKSYNCYVWPVRGGSGPILTPHSPP